MRKPEGKELFYPELSYQLVELAFEIHNELGPGFSENIYEAAFMYELKSQGIPFEEQKPIEITYKGAILGSYRLDLVIDSKIILELKAVSSLNDLFKQQLFSYLKASGMRLGILINFGAKRVEHVRVVC